MLAGPTFRDEQAKERSRQSANLTSRHRLTRTYEYHGYKANRAECLPDLAQQVPFIRRALEAFRIPILRADGL